MAAMRCGDCGISFPYDYRHLNCLACGQKTRQINNADPDPDWVGMVERLKERWAKADTPSFDILSLALEVRTDDDGRCWVSSTAMVALGYSKALVLGDIIEIPRADGAYNIPGEPDETLWEVQGYRDSTREYWVVQQLVPDTIPEEWVK